MRVVRNSLLPMSGYKAVTLWPFIFVRRDVPLTETDMVHERIHGEQQKEMLLLPFYVWYAVEFAVKLLVTLDWRRAYRSVGFEREAYAFEGWEHWLEIREGYYWMRFIMKVPDRGRKAGVAVDGSPQHSQADSAPSCYQF